MKREFTVVIEKGEDGYLIGTVPSLHGAHSQGRTVEELLGRMREVIELCLEELGDDADEGSPELVGVHRLAV